MYLLGIVLVGLIIGIWTSAPGGIVGKTFDWENFGTIIIVSSMIYGFSLLICYITISTSPNYIRYEFEDQEIKSLLNTQESKINGSFFLGCGTINGGSSEYYVAYAPSSKGDIRIKVDAYMTFLQENDSIPPVIKNYYVRKVRDAKKPGLLWARKERIGEWQKNYGEKIAIIPKNTVKVYGQYSIE